MADTHEDEYDDGMVAMLELIWGEGFLAPGGAGNVYEIVEGLDLWDKTVLDLGSGVGGVDLILAGEYGARVIGFEIEQALIERARDYAAQSGLSGRIEFRQVEPGPLQLDDACVDVVFSSGAIIHIDDKQALFKDIIRVLRPGGVLAVYDWLKGPDSYSDDMRYWFKMEGLTYAMDTLENYERMLREAGFVNIQSSDNTDWYREQAREEYARMNGELHEPMVAALGKDRAEHFVENWRATTVVLDNGELRTCRFRAHKPGG
jgi:phosphoethanolamine N-methyltransferase